MRPLSLWAFRPTTFAGSDATTLSTYIAQTGGPDIRNRIHVAKYFTMHFFFTIQPSYRAAFSSSATPETRRSSTVTPSPWPPADPFFADVFMTERYPLLLLLSSHCPIYTFSQMLRAEPARLVREIQKTSPKPQNAQNSKSEKNGQKRNGETEGLDRSSTLLALLMLPRNRPQISQLLCRL